MAKRSGSVQLAALFFGLLLVRLLTLLPLTIDVDEAWFGASGAAMSTPWQYFSHAVDNKPPGTAWFFWVVSKTLSCGSDPRFARGFYVVLSALAAWMLGWAVDRLEGLAPVDSRSENRTGNTLIGLRRRGWLAALLTLTALVVASPELFSTTTEGLMVVVVHIPLFFAFVMALSERATRRSRRQETLRLAAFVLCGSVFGFSLALKQTAVFFVPVAVLAFAVLLQNKHCRPSHAVAFFIGSLILPTAMLAFLPIEPLWFWNVVYPLQTLSAARGAHFEQWRNFAANASLFALALWPLVLGAVLALLGKTGRFNRSHALSFSSASAPLLITVSWFLGGVAAVVLGKGLFLHYFQLLIPPLVVVACLSGVRFSRLALGWLVSLYVFLAVVVAVPGLGPLWGADLPYYERLGKEIRHLTRDEDRVLIWGGNALALVTSERRSFSRYMNARFTTVPYQAARAINEYQYDFRVNPPELIVDLHMRGDNRFNIPLEHLPWLHGEVNAHYEMRKNPLLPWVVFYKRARLDIKTRRNEVNPNPWSNEFAWAYRLLKDQFGKDFFSGDSRTARLAANLVGYLPSTMRLESLFRSWDSLERLADVDPRLRTRPEFRIHYEYLGRRILQETMSLARPGRFGADDRDEAVGRFSGSATARDGRPRGHDLSDEDVRAWLVGEFEKRRMSIPLSLSSPLWWISYSLVNLQPVILPRDVSGGIN